MTRTTYTVVYSSTGRVAGIPPSNVQDYADRLRHKRVSLIMTKAGVTYEGVYDSATESVVWKTLSPW